MYRNGIGGASGSEASLGDEEGEEKLSNELDIVKILKTLRDMKILLKGTLLSDPGTKFHVKHAPKNILNLDETSDISSDGCHHGDDKSEDGHGHSHNLDALANGEAPAPKDLRHALSSNLKKGHKLKKKKNLAKK